MLPEENESLLDTSQESVEIPQEKESVNVEKDEDDFQTVEKQRWWVARSKLS